MATASLELGIDIGHIDLVCQIGSPRSIATLLQRIGRAGHAVGGTPKGRLFALTRDELLEALALMRAVRRGELDAIEVPEGPLDVLAQQIVAAVACEPWETGRLHELVRGAWPYRGLTRETFEEVVQLLSEGFAPGHRRTAYLHRDGVGGVLRARRPARLTALTCGGAIPQNAEYRVIAEPEGLLVGQVEEDFAIESSAGDIFLLGNASWRIRHVRGGQVTVVDAQGAPATVPFWFGEAPGRTRLLSRAVGELRQALAERVGAEGAWEVPEAARWLREQLGVSRRVAEEAAGYVAAGKAALGLVPTQERIVFERFFDESGGMQLVIHAPFGARINRAWGLALRKRFCRRFDFELQAAADDDGIVLSVGPQHSFPLEAMFNLVPADRARTTLVQALLASPLFQVRWRWNATCALAVRRFQGGRQVPPALQRFRSEDLLSAVFPTVTACFEHRPAEVEIPDHALVRQTVHDCLHEAMDLPGLLEVLGAIESGAVTPVGRDTPEPSPFAHALLNANPYAFLDDAPLEERRARAVAGRRVVTAEDVSGWGRLDPVAVEQVRDQARPRVRDAEELHDALLTAGALPAREAEPWRGWFEQLCRDGRATRLLRPGRPELWVAAEQWHLVRAALPDARAEPALVFGAATAAARPGAGESDPASGSPLQLAKVVQGRMEVVGPVTAEAVAADLGLGEREVEAALLQLEAQGIVLRGRFTREGGEEAPIEWCERGLLARIHRLTLGSARQRVRPVEPRIFLRFLLAHQHLSATAPLEGPGGVWEAVQLLQGVEAPAGAWERPLLAARVRDYTPQWLDELGASGRLAWGRLRSPAAPQGRRPSGRGLNRAIPIGLFARRDLPWLLQEVAEPPSARGAAMEAERVLRERGALFFDDLRAATGLLSTQLEEALAELAALGRVTADGVGPLRALAARRKRGRRAARGGGLEAGGRWSVFPGPLVPVAPDERAERWARQLLRRYGLVFQSLLIRERAAPPWGLLRRVYRRLEARGEVRGGRFVEGVSGEQFAHPPVVERLRALRDAPASAELVVMGAADPANLFGIVTPGPRVPPLSGWRIVVRDGERVAVREKGQLHFRDGIAAAVRTEVERRLRADASAGRVAVRGPRWWSAAALDPAGPSAAET